MRIIDGSSSFAVPPRSESNIEDKYDGNEAENLTPFSIFSDLIVKPLKLMFLLSTDVGSTFECTKNKASIKIHNQDEIFKKISIKNTSLIKYKSIK